MKINGVRPLLLVELRPARRRRRVRLGLMAAAVGAGAVGLLVPGARVELLGVEWALLLALVALAAFDRPCAACGRILQHTLACERGRL